MSNVSMRNFCMVQTGQGDLTETILQVTFIYTGGGVGQQKGHGNGTCEKRYCRWWGSLGR